MEQNINPKNAAVLDLTGYPKTTSLREAVLSLPRLEQQELAALAWLGSEVFEDFDVAFSYAQILKGRELVEFLEIIPALKDLDRGMRMLEDKAIHLS